MLCVVKSMGLEGMNAYMVDVELDFVEALSSFNIIGLPDATIKESRDRIIFGYAHLGHEFPDCKVRVNLAPADKKKTGPIYDVAMLVALMVSMGNTVPEIDLKKTAFLGELSLGGEIKAINGVLSMVMKAKESGITDVFVPIDNVYEASVVSGINVYGASIIDEVIDHVAGVESMTATAFKGFNQSEDDYYSHYDDLDFADVKGQGVAKRALEIAAAGSHNVILIGSPGSGKSMLAKRIPSILPEMTFEESIETTKIHSVAGVLPEKVSLIRQRPFRSPHHTVSPAGLSGGGTVPRPGEISLAHYGVLFLDEIAEFPRQTMEVLRQPLEDGKITISRVKYTLTYPCDVMFVAAMNPCQCGYYGHGKIKCSCTKTQVTRYVSRVSGPLLDRVDLHINVMPVDFNSLSSQRKEEHSSEIRKRVNRAREIQNKRFKGTGIVSNARIPASRLAEFCCMEDRAKTILKASFEKLGLSARAYDRILKVARTIADLDEKDMILFNHIAEAIQYRNLDRK